LGETIDEEIAYVKATKVLDGMTVEDRDKYVSEVLAMIAEAVKNIVKTKGKLNQLRAWQLFNKEMQQKGESGIRKGEVIMVCGLYAVKAKYRPMFIELLKVVTGIEETVKTEG
jgi:hypothetical protein